MIDSFLKNHYTSVDTTLINALLEDTGSGDITSLSLIPEDHVSNAVLIAKEDFVLAGMPFVERTFKLVDSESRFKIFKRDGVKVKKGDALAKIRGGTRSLLMTERVALNLLQRLSGIATLTHKFVERIKGLKTKITDTRKTTPGLRFFEKYAVKVGGGYNHRFGLFDGVLIKDNHIRAVGGVSRAVKLAQKRVHHLSKVEVEVKNIREVREALSAGADIIMLDNMPVDKIKKAVDIIRSQNPHIIIEASGNIKLESVRAIAATGVDLISIGALTHSAQAVDISMEILS